MSAPRHMNTPIYMTHNVYRGDVVVSVTIPELTANQIHVLAVVGQRGSWTKLGLLPEVSGVKNYRALSQIISHLLSRQLITYRAEDVIATTRLGRAVANAINQGCSDAELFPVLKRAHEGGS